MAKQPKRKPKTPPPPNPICYVELPAPALPLIAAFYKKVFGWKIGPKHHAGYWMFDADTLTGGFDVDKKPARDGVTLILKVADIPSMLDRVSAAGGKIVKRKTEIGGGYGFYAYIRDPAGNKIGIWSQA